MMTIEDIYNLCKPIAIYKTGSQCFLDNPRDKDIVLYFENQEEARCARKYTSRIIINAGYDPHFVVGEHISSGCYIVHFMEKLIGEDVDFGFEFLNIKALWLEVVKRLLTFITDEDKHWYRILTGVYIYENNGYNFTEEQLANIQKTHDEKHISQELKQHILDFVENCAI